MSGPGARPRRSRRTLVRSALLAGGTAAAVAVSGCGGASPARPSAAATATHSTTTAPTSASTGASVRVADCSLWQVLDPPARTRLLAAMHTFFGGPVDYRHGRGGALDAARATRLFDNYCRLPFARAFKLYKLYGRAAAFTPPATGSG